MLPEGEEFLCLFVAKPVWNSAWSSDFSQESISMSKGLPTLSIRLPTPRNGPVDLLIIAGEHSGDEHAARMVAAARERRPGLNVAALGGPRLAAAGAQLLHD